MGDPLEKPALDSERSGEDTAFDSSKYSHIVDWTRSSFIIHGRPVTIISAEFQYFRVPDRERWLPILADIKSMGFNAVRLYIHWGYHCAAEGVYNFRDNRDIEYLLSLCVQLQLFVITAPGPYICAEVQAGGYPIWLIAKRDLRVRHLTLAPLGMIKKWDQRWHDYCAEYMDLIVRLLAKWELTTNPNGCIIAMQIENELREKPTIGFGGIDGEIRLLCEVARKAGSTVPFFHNDDSPIGSWSAGGDYRSMAKGGMKTGKKAYRTDLYGFDLYLTFPPGDRSGDLSSVQVGMLEACGISACLNCCGVGGTGIGGSDTPCLSCCYEGKDKRHAPPPALGWSTANQMEAACDSLDKNLYSFNGSARYAPVIAAETQVGWINQWGRMRDYDDTYNFFGDDFSLALQNSLLSQGVNIINHYIAYGGTNHGTVGDTEVYTSYDYSAFIREFGLLSRRGRVLRQGILFARSFSDVGFSNSALTTGSDPKPVNSTASVKSSFPKALVCVRTAVSLETDNDFMRQKDPQLKRAYAFLRNLKEDNVRFSLVVDNLVLPCKLTKCESYVAPLYHPLKNCNLTIFACTVPVVCRTDYDGCEMWVLRVRPEEVGRLVLKRDGENSGDDSSKLAVAWAKVKNESSNSSSIRNSGELSVSHADDGAATSLYSGPLEELPLSNHELLAKDGAPVGTKASTEEPGPCFSFSFSSEEAFAVAVYDMDVNGSKNLVYRLLCLTDSDVDTFSANLVGNDCFASSSPSAFGAAWGVSNLTFLPDGKLDVGMSLQDEESSIFLLQQERAGAIPEQFEKGGEAIRSILPGVWTHKVQKGSLQIAGNHGVDEGNALSNNFNIAIENWTRRKVDWQENVEWKEIKADDIDPLDHLMTSGHTTYRIRFKCAKQRGSIVTNIRHSAIIWCNGTTVGSQICFSHNVMSAGAMHGIDLQNAGKRRHDLSKGLRNGPDADGFHEVIILVLSMGQGRSPFLLNDVRNKRGLLSYRLSRTMGASDVRVAIAGVDVTKSDDAYKWSGLHLENEANNTNFESDFLPAPEVGPVIADDGIVFYRGTFRVPANSVVGGGVAYPLRLKVLSGAGVRACIWVNSLFMGRYVEPLGPQTDFYVPEGLIKECKGNSIVVAVYSSVDSRVSFELLPWIVDQSSGNCDEKNGSVYALRKVTFDLNCSK